MRTHILRATLAALALLTLSACSGTSSTAPSTPSPTASSTHASASTSGSSEAATSEAAAPSTDASTDASAPADTAALSFDDISIDITDARQAELSQPAGRTLAGTAGVQVNLKIANTSDQAIDAAPLSFPTLKLDDGTEVTGFALTSDGAETTYGIIEPGKSQELTLFFPTDQAPGVLSITLLNPLEPTQTLTVQTDF